MVQLSTRKLAFNFDSFREVREEFCRGVDEVAFYLNGHPGLRREINGGLLLTDIEVEPSARKHPLKQRS